MRIFVASELPNKTRENLTRSVEQMRHFATKGNFVPSENYHVTLHFLGEVAESDLIYVQSAMDKVRLLPAPQCALSQFAVLRGNGIVCAKLRQDGALTKLHDKLGEHLEQNGFDVEHRAYRPHITVLRNFAFELPFSEVTKSVDIYNKPFFATEVVLYQSVLSQSGATYRELYRVSLKAQD